MSGVKYPDKSNKYYTPKGTDGAYGVETGYKYGQYKPGMVKDNGKPLKKNGRKKGSTLKSRVEVSNDVGKVVNLMTFGAKVIKGEQNIIDGVKPNVRLNIHQACDELGIKSPSFYHYLKKFPDAREEYEQLKESRREYMREMSEMNIEKALSGKMKQLGEKDVVDYSFRMLERTDKNYSPKQVVETTVEQINPDRSTEDIIGDIADLIRI